MPNHIEDIRLKIVVRQADGSPLTESVDIDFQHQALSYHHELRGIDPARSIEITGLRRAPSGLYKVTVTPAGQFEPQAQFVNVPASGFTTLDFVFGQITSEDYTVKGAVRYSNGEPGAGLVVRAYDLDLRSEQLLGEIRTDNKGEYQIRYKTQSFARAEKDTADLFVRVLKEKDVLYDPGIAGVLFNAPQTARMDVLLPGKGAVADEYSTIAVTLKPLLNGVAPSDLRDDASHPDITFLAGETGIDRTKLVHFAVAQRETAAYNIMGAFFYALFAENTLLKVGTARAFGARFDIQLDTDIQALFFDIVLLAPADITAAVEQAIDDAYVSAELKANLPGILNELERYRAKAEAYVRDQRPKALFSQVQQFLAAGKQQEVMRILAQDSGGDLPGLFERFLKVSAFAGQQAAADAKTAMMMSDALGFDAQIVDQVRDLQGIQRPEDVRRLAALDRSGWKDVLQKAAGSIRTGGQPIRSELIDIHASSLVRRMEARFPTVAFAAQLERDHAAFPAHRAQMAAFFSANPEFDLAATNIEVFLKKKPQAAAAAAGKGPSADLRGSMPGRPASANGTRSFGAALSQQPTKDVLKAMQRVFKLAPKYRQSKALLDAGVHSAAAIHAMGEKRFVARFGGTDAFTVSEAADTFHKASSVHSATALVAGELQAMAGATSIAALDAPIVTTKLQAVTRDFPNLKSLFQLTDYCECSECRTVHSAAAYLVDALQFLKNRLVVDSAVGPPAVKIAKDVLFSRRPELGDIDLNCSNTNTPVPYIDLVCEVLEEVVSPDPGFAFSGAIAPGVVPPALLTALQANGFPFADKALIYDADLNGNFTVRDQKAVCKLIPNGPNAWIVRRLRQTFGAPAEVAAAPEYVNQQAYTALRTARYAFRLPFDLSHEETRAYFQQFDIARDALMRALQIASGPHDNEIAAEALSFSDVERQLIVTADPGSQDTYWDTIPNPAPSVVQVVDTFLTKTGLEYGAVQELLDREWINPGGAMFIRHLDNTCDLVQKQIQNLDANALDRLHRFIRLWKKIQWKTTALDRAIRAPRLGNGQLDDSCLVQIANLVRLSSRLKLSLDELCNFYDVISSKGDDSRYAQIFLNPAANGRVENDFLPVNVAQNEADEIAVPGSGKKLSAYANYVALCIGAKQTDCDRLIAAIPAPAILSFTNLAAVYSRSLLAKTLKLTAAELLILESLTGIDVLHSPLDTLNLLDKLDKARAAGVKPADLQYLLAHEADDLDARTLSDNAILAILGSLQAGYQAAFQANRSPFNPSAPADENKNAARDLLARLPDFTEADLSLFQNILDDNWSEPAITPPNYIDRMLAAYVDTTPLKAAQAALAGAMPPKETERNNLIQAVSSALSGYFYVKAKNELASAALVKALKMAEEMVDAILSVARLKQPPAAGHRTLLDLLTDDSLIDNVNTPPVPPAITPAAFDNQYRALRLLHTMNILLGNLALSPDRAVWMLNHNVALGWLELDNLAYEAGIAPTSFASWEQLRDVVSLAKTYPPVQNPTDAANSYTFYGLWELVLAPGTAVGDIIAYLVQLTGWDENAITALDARFGFSAVNLSPYRLPATYLRLDSAITLLRRLGIDVGTGVALSKAQLTAADATAARSALKARYQDSEWLGVLRSIQDILRVKKRDALVAYLMATNPSLKSTDDLFDYFLVDVEMCSCQPTSRIVQAHGTVQLFAQRCLMGLEPGSVASVSEDPEWEQWKWMANYRVWEANRKIFLWPENWIEPELRDDKSELFVELENTLQQNDLTDEAVTDAATTYLEKLDEIAFMDVMAVYYQTDIYTMHVFGRTKGGDPGIVYYRQFQKERYWTPWEKVDLDISGDHLLAFDRNSRLTLAWPVFTEEPDSTQTSKIPNPNEIPSGGQTTDQPRKRWKIQLAVSERARDKWLPKKVSRGALYTSFTQTPPSSDEFQFFVWSIGAAGQAITCLRNGAYMGSFALTGCKGYPEPIEGSSQFLFRFLPQFKDTKLLSERFTEQNLDASDDLAIRTIFNIGAYDPIVNITPGTFRVTYPLQMSLIDWILLLLELYLGGRVSTLASVSERYWYLPVGTFMPYFYGDVARDYAIVPGFYGRQTEDGGRLEKTFSDILKFVQDVLALAGKYLLLYQTDPNHDLQKLLTQLVADPEYQRLSQEYQSYSSLTFGLKFQNFYHPLTCFLRSTLNQGGIPALMRRDTQLKNTGFNFNNGYMPAPLVASPYPMEDLDFSSDGSYSSYNWEMFFHLPFEIASRLSSDQRFEEARDWYHYIFNPVGATDAPAPQKYWITKPFFQATTADYVAQRIDSILYAIGADPSGATIPDLKFAVEEWRDKPFKPHVIARTRPVAYQQAVLMKYIKNLVDWGDSLFRQDTMESVNQATQMYILADKLLGPKPRLVPQAVAVPSETYNQLEAKIDLFGNALLDLENILPDISVLPHGGAELPPSPITFSLLYFCIPPNENMLQIWDLVADRLFKIRNCQNIDGVERVLALFAPPIDPGALVRAAAAGLDISAVIAGLSAPLPNYRFSVLAQKATELAQQVSGLGSSLLQAIEKRDAEKLARLRSTQEASVLNAVRAVKQAQIAEGVGSVESLKQGRHVTEERKAYYSSQVYMNTWEITAGTLAGLSLVGQTAIAVGYALSGGLKLVPQFLIGAAGFGGSPTAEASTGGQSFGDSAEDAAKTLTAIAGALDKAASMAATQAGYQRRQDDWDFQVRLANKELAQIDQQIATANLHVDMLNRDLAAHDVQIANNKQMDEFLHTKYTNQELYDWMIGQISSVYFKAYQLAFDVAKKAERCFRHELGATATFLSPGYWDSLKKGLTATDGLLLDIKRMEVAYLDQNKREFELTKHASLAQIDPAALMQLKNTGKCIVQIPEAVFDIDHPGHYMRRLKSVSLSIPCVAGPYTTVSCKLSLISNRYRKNTVLLGGATNKDKYEEQPGNDTRFVYNVGTIQSIATSNSQSDTGTFELNYHDDRYLPFEGTGAICAWQLELPQAFPQFDYNTVTDVILHLRYTARDGGAAFRALVEGVQRELLNEMALSASHTGLYQAYNLRRQFPNEWSRLKQAGTTQMTLGVAQLPFFVQEHAAAIDAVSWMGRLQGNPATYVMLVDGAGFNMNRNAAMGNLCVGSSNVIVLDTAFTLAAADTSALDDLTMLIHYTLGA